VKNSQIFQCRICFNELLEEWTLKEDAIVPDAYPRSGTPTIPWVGPISDASDRICLDDRLAEYRADCVQPCSITADPDTYSIAYGNLFGMLIQIPLLLALYT
jgi:hypothetical protein